MCEFLWGVTWDSAETERSVWRKEGQQSAQEEGRKGNMFKGLLTTARNSVSAASGQVTIHEHVILRMHGSGWWDNVLLIQTWSIPTTVNILCAAPQCYEVITFFCLTNLKIASETFCPEWMEMQTYALKAEAKCKTHCVLAGFTFTTRVNTGKLQLLPTSDKCIWLRWSSRSRQ